MLFLNGYQDWGLLALRIAIGLIFIYHGLPKLNGKMAKKMAPGVGLPVWAFTLVGLFEVLAGIEAILGIYTQFAAAFFALIMLGAIHLKMNKWKVPFSAQKGTGWEFDFILLGAAIALLLLGAGNISLDALFGYWP